jgi:hypothetical protein
MKVQAGRGAPNLPVRSPASASTIERPASVRRFMFGPSHVLAVLATTTSAVFCHPIPESHNGGGTPLPGPERQSSRATSAPHRRIFVAPARMRTPHVLPIRRPALCLQFFQTPPRDDMLVVRPSGPIKRSVKIAQVTALCAMPALTTKSCWIHQRL